MTYRESDRRRIERLTQSGQLEAFETRRKALREQYKTEGIKDAGSRAYREACLEFAEKPPEPPEPVDGSVDLEAFAHKGRCSYLEVLHWVADHIDARDVQVADAPAARAWSLLRQARADPKWFFAHVFSKVVPGKIQQQKDEESLSEEDFQRGVAMIQQIAADCNRDEELKPEWWTELPARLAAYPAKWKKLQREVDAALKGRPVKPEPVEEDRNYDRYADHSATQAQPNGETHDFNIDLDEDA